MKTRAGFSGNVILLDPDEPEAVVLLDLLTSTLAKITGDGGASSFIVDDVRGYGAGFAIARDENGKAVGCGAFRPLSPSTAEIKRMFALPGTSGVGAAILEFLEKQASTAGYQEIWLETRKINHRAVSFYLNQGYECMPNFGRYAGRKEAVCFRKDLRILPQGAAYYSSEPKSGRSSIAN